MAELDSVETYPPEAQLELCRPEKNVDAAAFFITNFCKTLDEDRAGEVRPIPAKKFVLRLVRALDFKDPETLEPLPPANLHIEKSRRMLATWIAAAYNVWALSFLPGYTARVVSKNEDAVDDGGLRSTTDSFFGRMRFVYDRLPEHLKRGLSFAYMRVTSETSDGFVVGGAPTKDAGRSGGYTRFWADEFAFLDWASSIHKAADPACKFGKVYISTVNGPDNLFAVLKKERPKGWRFVEVDWKDDPDKAAGLRETEPGPERERYGAYVNEWFRTVTASLTDEMIAQEYGRNYSKSTLGMVFREFSRELHVRPRGTLRFDKSLPLYVGIDLGHARKTAAAIGQPVEMRALRIIGDYAGEFRNSGDNAKGLANRIRELGYEGSLEEVYFVPDPSALNEEVGSGLSIVSYYRAIGFTNIIPPLIEGANSVFLGCNVLRVLFQRNVIAIAEEAEGLVEAIPAYRLPVDKATNEVKSNKPLHNMASHFCDGLRYLATSIWTADDLPYEGLIWDGSPRYPDEAPHVDGRIRRFESEEDELAGVFSTVASNREIF